MTPEQFFAPWEPPAITSFEELLALLDAEALDTLPGDQRVFAWRGVVDAGYPLHSSLYRRMVWSDAAASTELDLGALEGQVLADAHRWELHYHGRSHLPMLYELATLQHFGAPTRLIDVSFSPLIALWFAVEDQRDAHGESKTEHVDGRIFVFDVTDRLINESSADQRRWEELSHRAWALDETRPEDWTRRIWAWRPAPTEARFAAQHGGFIFGGVPQTGRVRWRVDDRPGAPVVPIEDVRRCTSLAVRFHKLDPGNARRPDHPAYTVRISADAKQDIREKLQRYFDLHARTIYPDHMGFGMFGLPTLARDRPAACITTTRPVSSQQP